MAKGSKREGGGIGELLAYAGDRKFLTYLGMALSALSQLLSFGPYVCIWLVARDLIAVAPNWSEACDIATYGWWAVGFALASIVAYFVGLMCTHLSAFRCASNIRKTTSEHLLKLPLGYFDTHATGELRRIVDGCAASTETLLAHMLPDIAGATAMVAGLLVLLFALDWRLGAACLISVVVSFGAMATMMSGKGAEFMKAYMGALVKMNKTGTEYVRGIPVVKVFQQTVYSFKAFHDAIAEYADMAQNYAGTFCRGPQVLNLTALNGLVAVAPLAQTHTGPQDPLYLVDAGGAVPDRLNGVAVGARRDGLRAFYDQLHVLRDIFGRGTDGYDQAHVCGRGLSDECRFAGSYSKRHGFQAALRARPTQAPCRRRRAI